MRHLLKHLRGWNLRRKGHMPRWVDDPVARMLGVAQYGCPNCGYGAIRERDRALLDGGDQ